MHGQRSRAANGLFAVATLGLIAGGAGIGWLLDPARREAAAVLTETNTAAEPLASRADAAKNSRYLDLVSFRRADGDERTRFADLAQASDQKAEGGEATAAVVGQESVEIEAPPNPPAASGDPADAMIRLPSTNQGQEADTTDAESGEAPPVPGTDDSAVPIANEQVGDAANGSVVSADGDSGEEATATDEDSGAENAGQDGDQDAEGDAEEVANASEAGDEEMLPPVEGDTTRIMLNFQDAPWDVVLKRLAEEAGYAVQLDVLPPGSFTYLSSKPMTLSEAIDLFNGYLYSSGHLIIRKQNLISVVKTEEPIPSHLIPMITPEELGAYGKNELLSMEVPLNTIDPVAAAAEVNGLLSPLGRAIPLPSAQRIVVTDFGQNLRQLYEMLWSRESDPLNPPQVVFKLKNSKAEDVAKAINDYFATQRASFSGSAQSSRPALAAGQVGPGVVQASGTVSSGDGLAIPEPTSNSILVNATTLQMEKIRQIIDELDCIPPQIVIQALLVEVDLGSVDELGVELGVQDSVLFDRSVVDNLVTVTETVSNPATGIATTNQSIISQTADPGFNFNNKPLGNNIAANPSKVGSQGLANFAVGRVNGDLGYGGLVLSAGSESVSALLRALSARRKVDILSRPQVRTLENQPAEIQIGQQVPVVDGVTVTPVGSANPVIRQDQAGLILKVVPRVSAFDEVVIEVEAEKSEFNTTPGSGIPIFTDATTGNVIEAPIKNVSKATTMVSCMAGQTIILGGMISKGTNIVERKVPLLGDIPVVGWLFRYDYEQVGRKELLIFLTPQVIRSARDSDLQTAKEARRMHLPIEDTNQLHGPNPAAPEKFQPRGMKYPEWPWFHRKKKSEVVIEEAPVVSDLFPSESYPVEGSVVEPLGEGIPGGGESTPPAGEELPAQPFLEKREPQLPVDETTR